MFKWISNWFQKTLSRPYEKVAEGLQSEIEKLSSKPKDVSEPVISIVESFKEKGRWKVKPLFDLFTHQNTLYSFEIRDSRTGETHTIYSHRCYYYYTETKQFPFPDKIHSYSSPSWMTTEEWDYVCVNAQRYMNTINERFKVIKDRKVKTSLAQAKVNQEKERQRLISIYCKEEV